jgi:ketosteroid isomerase-like protein
VAHRSAADAAGWCRAWFDELVALVVGGNAEGAEDSMKGYVIHSRYWHGDLSFAPVDGSIHWVGSAAWSAAHVFTERDARAVVAALPAQWRLHVFPSYGRAEPMPIPANAQLPAKSEAA